MPGTKPGSRLTKFDAEILHDFRLSFRFSQGDPDFQDLLILDRARQYSPSEQAAARKRSPHLRTQVASMTIPVNHSEGDEGQKIVPDMLDQFGDHFETYINCLNGLVTLTSLGISWTDQDLDAFNALSDGSLTEQLALRMLRGDIEYVTQGRPNRVVGTNDIYESFVHTYAFMHKDTRSRHYNLLNERVRRLLFIPNGIISITEDPLDPRIYSMAVLQGGKKLISTPAPQEQVKQKLVEGVSYLKRIWEEKHPNESFFSQGA